MRKITQLIERNISGKKVLALFLLTNGIYSFMLAYTIPKVMEFSNGMKLLDMMPMGYDLDYVNELFSSLGENGRNVYLTTQIPVDMVYPFLFAISYCLVFGYFLKKMGKLKLPYTLFCLLPIISGIADYLENLGIIIMLNSYPQLGPVAVNFTATFSLIKSSSTTLYFIALIVLLILFGIKSLSRKKGAALYRSNVG